MTTFRLPRQFQHTRCLHFPSRSTSKVCVKSLCDYANSLPCSARYIYIYMHKFHGLLLLLLLLELLLPFIECVFALIAQTDKHPTI